MYAIRSYYASYQAALYFFQGRDQHYFRGEYDEAMLPLLYAWRKYRQAYLPVNVTRMLHMLGMVQTKRRHRAGTAAPRRDRHAHQRRNNFV